MNHIALDPNGGKGDKWRRVDFKKYRDNYDKIFSKKKGKKDDRRISKCTKGCRNHYATLFLINFTMIKYSSSIYL